MVRPKARRNHTTSEFLLRNFVDDEGWLYSYRKLDAPRKLIKARPRKTFVERDLYALRSGDGEIDDSLEIAWSQLEDRTSPVVRRILSEVRKGRMPTITLDDQRAICHFIYYQWKRSPDVLNAAVQQVPLESSIQDFKTEARERGESVSPDQEFLTLADRKLITHNAKVFAAGMEGTMVLPLLERFTLVVIRIGLPDCSFVIGSTPIVLNARSGIAGQADIIARAVVPISHDVALALCEGIPESQLHVLGDRHVVRGFNESVFEQSTAIASGSRQLVIALARRFNFDVS